MGKLTRTQTLVLAAAARWPLTYTAWADGFTQAYMELPNGLQVVKSPTVKGLLESGLLAQPGNEHEGPLEVTAAGHEALAAAPAAVAEVSTPGWRLTATQDRRVEFNVGGTAFVVTTSGWPNTTSADLMAQHVARSMTALHGLTPDKFERELAGFTAGIQGAFAAIAEEALDVIHLLHPEVVGYSNNVSIGISARR